MTAVNTSPRPMVVGLTGGIGSGKSTVADLLHRQFGIRVIDADQVARDVVAVGQPALEQIATHFGSDMLLADGSLNRSRLRECVFADEDARQWLNKLLHPLIRQGLLTQLDAPSLDAYQLLMAPLLFENNLDKVCALTVVVDATTSQQQQRAGARDGKTASQIAAVMTSQWSREQRLAQASLVLDNNGEPQALPAKVADLHQQLLDLSPQHQGALP